MSARIEISRAALHELLTDAHMAIVEHRADWAGAVLHTLRKLTAPEAVQPQGRARRLMDEISLPGGLGIVSPPAAEAVPQPPASASAHAAGCDLPPRPFGGAPVVTWTPARVAMLRERFPSCDDDAALLAALNALPGPLSIHSTKALCVQAAKLGLKRAPEIIRAMRSRGGRETNARRQSAIGGRQDRTWTPERQAALTQLWPTTSAPDVLTRLNAMPGPPVASVKAVRERAKRLVLRLSPEALAARKLDGARKAGEIVRQRATVTEAAPAAVPLIFVSPPAPEPEPKPEPAPERTPEEEAAIADAAVMTKQDRVKASIREAMARGGGGLKVESQSAIAVRHGLPLREVMRLTGEVRREQVAA